MTGVRGSPARLRASFGSPASRKVSIPIQQGEEFFTALYRQNKPASFVRYWGEGHIFASPANVVDMWARIYAWLARYL